MSAGRLIVHRPDMAVPVELPAATGATLRAVPAVPSLVEPTLVELAANFGGAMARWVSAGAPVVSEEVYRARSAACEGEAGLAACPFWDGMARLGLGKCKAPGCGCTSLKRWLATEACKHPQGSRWPR